jgi:hypothetical protein
MEDSQMSLLKSITKIASTVLVLTLLGYSSIASARFLSADPMGVDEHVQRYQDNLRRPAASAWHPPLEINPYAAVANNPLRWIDPDGRALVCPMCLEDMILGGGGGGLGGGGGGGGYYGGRGAVPASTPVGSSRSPINVPSPTNAPATISGRPFSGHALDRMQGRGIPPSIVENTLQTGRVCPGRSGTTQYYGSTNNVTVVVDTKTGTVVTVHQGPPAGMDSVLK